MGRLKSAFAAAKARAAKILDDQRKAWPPLDHVVRTATAYQDRRGNRQAAGLTYYAFLSLFPLIALAFGIAGYIVAYYPQAGAEVTKAIDRVLPGLTAQLDVEQIARAKAGAGIAGLVLLLWGGLGWIGALREALRSMMGLAIGKNDMKFVAKKLRDLVALVLLGLTLVISVGLSTLATSATPALLSRIGLGHSGWTGLAVRPVSVAVAVLTDMAVCYVLFRRLAGSDKPAGKLLRGVLLGAVGLDILKLAGTFLIARMTRNPVYASFAVTIGLLLWINFTSRVILFAASWTAEA
jgi:membrane protein